MSKQCEGVDGLGSFDYPPEQCEEDALDGACFCARHIEGLGAAFCSDHAPEWAEEHEVSLV